VLIYSPTIESGVNFDQVGVFSKLYIIASAGCNSQRALLQMMSRVRKIEDLNVSVYCLNLKYYEVDPKYFYCYDEVKKSLTALKIIELTESYKNGLIIREILQYDINYIFGKTEELMKNSNIYYLSYLKLLLEKKGHTVTVSDYYKNQPKNEYKIDKIDNILSIKDITDDEFEYLLDKQKKSKASNMCKLKIKKHFLKRSLGVDFLDYDILEKYKSPSVIKNLEYLIDDKNVRINDDVLSKETKLKAKIVKNIIDKLGLEIFNKNIQLSKGDFKNRLTELIETNDVFKNTKLRALFTTFSYKTIKTTRDFMMFVNSILESYGLCLTSNNKRIKKSEIEDDNKTQLRVYGLDFCKNYNTINEPIQYKINKGYKLHDCNNIRPVVETTEFNHLIKEVVEEDVKEDAENENVLDSAKYDENPELIDNDYGKYPDPFGLDYGL